MKIYSGTIITCDTADTVCHYLIEENGIIQFTGDQLPKAYQKFPVEDLGTGALIPAFTDSHLHFSSYALFSSTLDLRAARNFDDISEMIRAYIRKSGCKLVLGFGISAHSLIEQRMITREELDRIEKKRPMMLVKYDGHASVVNSAMLRLLPAKIKTLRGFDADAGQLFQEAFFAATDHITAKISVISLLKYMLNAVDQMADNGIALIHPAEGVGFFLDLDVDIVRLVARGLANPFQFRVFFQTMAVQKVMKRKLPRIGGCFATALDGCFGSVDAALNQPYAHDSKNCGILFYPDQAVLDFIQNAHDQGLQVQVHAIGDAAFDQATQAFETVLKNNYRADHRHSIIHASLVSQKGLDICANYQIGIAAQPALLDLNLEPLSYLTHILGSRAEQISPFKRMVEMGIHVSGGSDAPVTLPDPITGIHCACNHYNADQSLSILQALKMFTWETAWAGFDEQHTGSLEAGKTADMVVLDKNPLDMNPKDLKQLQVQKLYLKGKPFQKGQGLTTLLWNSLFKPR